MRVVSLPGRPAARARAALAAFAALALLALAPGAFAHPGNGGAAFDARRVVEGEDYDRSYYVGQNHDLQQAGAPGSRDTSRCDLTGDGEHTRVSSTYPDTSGGQSVIIPNDNCGVYFDDLLFPIAGELSMARVLLTGAAGAQGGTMAFYLDGGPTPVAQAKVQMVLNGTEGWVDVAFPGAATIAAGAHDLRIDWQVESGAAWVNLWVDCFRFEVDDGESCIPPPPSPPAFPPQAAFSWSERTDCLGSLMSFDASASADPDGFVRSFQWDFGDGWLGTGRDPQHAYAEAGSYLVTLKAVDDDGLSHTVRSTVISAGDPNCPIALGPLPDLVVWAGDLVRVCPSWSDPDPQDLPTWSRPVLPPGARFGEPGPCLEWVPQPRHAGSWGPIRIEVSDGLTAASRSFTIQVLAATTSSEDRDHDGVSDIADNCATTPNQGQGDADGDGVGDACDPVAGPEPEPGVADAMAAEAADLDRDGVADLQDNCPARANRGQQDLDADRVGDACDPDLDGDGVPDAGPAGFLDSCPTVANADQADADGDGIGDACDGPIAPMGAQAPARPALPVPEPSLPLAALAAAGAALLALALPRLRAAGPWLVAAVARQAGRDVARHPLRAALLEAIRANPGAHQSEVVRLAGRARRVVVHHLAVLERAGRVRCETIAGYRCYFLAGAPTRLGATRALRAPLARQVLERVEQAPGADTAGLARDLGVSYMGLSYHVRRLEQAGLIRAERRGKARALFPGAAGHPGGWRPIFASR